MIKLTRTKTFALLGLAVVLLVAALILWRPFGSSPSSQSNQSPNGVSQSGNIALPTRSPPPERVVHFPEDRSIGELYIRDWDSTWSRGGWTRSGEAEGKVTVPEGKELRLYVIGSRDQDLSFLAEIGEHDLHTLHFSGSNLTITDRDLRFIQHLRSLRELVLERAKITDFRFTHFSGLTSLEALYLHNTEIGDTGMEEIGNLTSLSELHIRHTNVTDKGLAEIGRLPSLRTLVLAANPRISDVGLRHLQSLTHLEWLDLRITSITDNGLTYLQSMRSLKRLLLQGIQITPNGVASLKAALPNTQVEVFTPTPSPTPIPILPTRPPVS